MDTFEFQRAQAVWILGREKEKNCELAFRILLPRGRDVLYLAASTVYRLCINGEFVCTGPARAAHGYYNVDRIELTDHLAEEMNVIVIEVAGYNVNTYDTLDQPAFLTAEVVQNGEVVCCTGDGRIQCCDMGQRVRKVQRYSFQRAFVECYDLRTEKAGFYTEALWEKLAEYEQPAVPVTGHRIYLKRSVREPEYERLRPETLMEVGQAVFRQVSPAPLQSWETKPGVRGYRREELEVHLTDEVGGISLAPFQGAAPAAREGGVCGSLPGDAVVSGFGELNPATLQNGYMLYRFPFNATGFLRTRIRCAEPCTIYLLFDEILEEGRLDCMRMSSVNCIRYTLDAGIHRTQTFAPYTMKYVQVVVKGRAILEEIDMVEYKHPPVKYCVRLPEDQALERIYRAALESYLSNAVDLFTDCPSRERAGWLCDSFFTARVEHVLTGESVLEKAFLENFILPDHFANLPRGMLPMCYPADDADGYFIPNWAMWFVLELEEYLDRSGDRKLVEQARERLYGLAVYFQDFENEYGLLEGLESWVFVEWSRANDADVVQDVNFPTNMLYMRMLSAMASLYGDESFREKAQGLRKVIRERSFDGEFYTDNERRENGILVNPGNHTEVCQYYAFFTGTADRGSDAALWERLNRDFGPQRRRTGKYPEVAFANAFIGNYLRIELLYRNGQYEDVLENIRGYFAAMAERTGTLWEHDSPTASCNHGFASHVIYWLAGIYGVEKGKKK